MNPTALVDSSGRFALPLPTSGVVSGAGVEGTTTNLDHDHALAGAGSSGLHGHGHGHSHSLHGHGHGHGYSSIRTEPAMSST